MKFQTSHLALWWCVGPLLGYSCSAVAENSPDGTLGDILSPLVKILECNTQSPEVQLLCNLVVGKIKPKLAAAGLSITKDALLFSYDDPADVKINTGHDCSVTAAIKCKRASARLDASASIDLSGNPLSGAGVVAVRLPVELSAEINAVQKNGVKNPFTHKCQVVATDGFDVLGGLSTTAQVLVFFALAPALTTDPQGNFVLTIKPITSVISRLESTQLRAHISGRSPLSGILDFVLGLPGAAVAVAADILRGDSLAGAWDKLWQQFPLDLAIGTVMSIPDEAANAVIPAAAKLVVKKMQKAADARLSEQLQTQLQQGVARILGLDAKGERRFVIRKDFAQLVAQSGVDADVWLPEKGASQCATDADCDDHRFCNGKETCRGGTCISGQPPCRIAHTTRCNEMESRCDMVINDGCGAGTGRICPRAPVLFRA